MNIDNKIDKIIYPVAFNSDFIRSYYKLNTKLKTIIEESGYKNEFTKKYRKCLNFLNQLKINCIKQNSFEKLSYNKNLFSMRLTGEKNIRILFAYIKIHNKQIAVLLHGFQEKGKKGHDGYRVNIEIAEQRLEEIKEIIEL